MKAVTTKIVVSGRVQGVYFRASTLKKADELKLKGYVRNLSNGNVEIIAQGKDEIVGQLIEWAHVGPSRAIVEEVNITPIKSTGKFKEFTVK